MRPHEQRWAEHRDESWGGTPSRYGVPPLGEARVVDWIRLHACRANPGYGAERIPGTVVTSEELDAAAIAKRCRSFAFRRALAAGDGRLCDAAFEALRMSRLRMGHLRYGVCGRNMYDAIGSCAKRADEYDRTGNREHLVDIVNLAEIEWIHPTQDGWWARAKVYKHTTIQEMCYTYKAYGCRGFLVAIADAAEDEWVNPTHPNAHWAPQDCGGHWSLRNL